MNYGYAAKDRKFLQERLGSIEQLAYIRQSVLNDGRGRGCRIAEAVTGSGLNFTVNLDRAMDIVSAGYKGIPFAWISQNGLVSPQFYEADGENWLGTWGGGLLTGCGLVSAGNPNQDGGRDFGLHGRISHIPAQNFTAGGEWIKGRYVLTMTGAVRQSYVFNENLLMTRKITAVMGESSIILEDTIENQGFRKSPLMVLYHINVGYPMLDENGTIAAVKHNVTPRTKDAAGGLKSWHKTLPPVAGIAPEVFYHEIPAGKDGFAAAVLNNPQLGLAFKLEYRTAELPYLIQWKNMDRQEYVMGLEPANCHPDGLAAERKNGTLREIAPGETVVTKLKISIIEL